MNVAVTVWENRISPVFDSAQTLLIATTENGSVVRQRVQPVQTCFLDQFVGVLHSMDVEVLICGALCVGAFNRLQSSLGGVFPFLSGEVDEVLHCFLQRGDLRQFAMPGCGQLRCCRSSFLLKNKPFINS